MVSNFCSALQHFNGDMRVSRFFRYIRSYRVCKVLECCKEHYRSQVKCITLAVPFLYAVDLIQASIKLI